MGFQVGLDAPATSSSSTDDARMQGMRLLDFHDSPQPWARPAGSSVTNEADIYHVPNNRTCASHDGRISHEHYQNVDHSRGTPVGPALEVKRSAVGSRGVTAAAKARRKDPNQPGKFLCTVCGADLTSNHNLTSKVVRYWSLLRLIVSLQSTWTRTMRSRPINAMIAASFFQRDPAWGVMGISVKHRSLLEAVELLTGRPGFRTMSFHNGHWSLGEIILVSWQVIPMTFVR